MGELLEGMSFDGCPGFETWLLVERRRLASSYEALLHEEALRHLGAGRYGPAVDAASRLVTLNPLDENYQALLVRSLTASGDRAAALDQVARCIALFEQELGTGPSPAVRAAADGDVVGAVRSAASGRAAAAAQLEAGQAAVNAGAIDAGLECLRRAVAEADALRRHRAAAPGAERPRRRTGARRPGSRRGRRGGLPRGPRRGRGGGRPGRSRPGRTRAGLRRRPGRAPAARRGLARAGGDVRRSTTSSWPSSSACRA